MNLTNDDNLLSEIVDGGSIERAWNEWETRADADPASAAAMWRRLACAQRDQLALIRAMNSAAARSEEMQCSLAGAIGRDEERTVSPGQGRIGTARTWFGWAAAAIVVLTVTMMQLREPAHESADSTGSAIQHAGWSPQQHFQQYLQQGREQGTVIGELPRRVLIDARPSASGIGYDVVFLRQIQERATVPDLYEIAGTDETGRVQMVGYEPPRGGAM